MCRNVYEKGWSDEEADAEYVSTFTEAEREDERELVCDDCYKRMGFG